MRPQTHRANEWTRSVTSFAVCRGTYPPLMTEESVLLVHNISDADIARAKGNRVEPNKDGKERGKPAGFGLPGGGMKGEDFENPQEAAGNELMGETGIRILTARPFLTEFKGFKTDRSGEMVGNQLYFEKGQRPPIELNRGETAVENHLHLFEATIDWAGSRLQQVFIEAKKDLLSQFTEEELAKDGITIWLDEMDSILERLGVDPHTNVDEVIARKEIVEVNNSVRSRARAALYLGIEEFEEIDGLIIIPLRTLLQEVYPEEKRKAQGQRLFYTSHLRRLMKGFENQGCLNEILSAT